MFTLDPTRRDLIRLAAAAMVAGTIDPASAQHVHTAAADEKKATGAYKPKALNAHEYKTIEVLSEMIFPADAKSKGALAAGAPEFIDLLCSQNSGMAAIYFGGLAWMDRWTQREHQKAFADCTVEQRKALLDKIAFRANDAPDLAPGIHFFTWVRKMTADAYYTSKVGFEDLGYKGNVGMTKFVVPVESIQYALDRSPLKG